MYFFEQGASAYQGDTRARMLICTHTHAHTYRNAHAHTHTHTPINEVVTLHSGKIFTFFPKVIGDVMN